MLWRPCPGCYEAKVIALTTVGRKNCGVVMGARFLNLQLLIVVIGTLSISACNKSEPDDSLPVPNYETSNGLYGELKIAHVGCEASECENSRSEFESVGLVGMLIKGKPTDLSFRLGQCTGFLYGSNDIVALNSHCISDSMWENRTKCSEYLGIKFPATPGHGEEIRMCEEILFRSNLEEEQGLNIQPDYAYFRIKPVDRKYLVFSNYPVKNNDEIVVRKMNPAKTSGVLAGYMDYAHCKAVTESILNIQYTSEWSTTGLGVSNGGVGTKTCRIVKGNSGSPVLNSRGEIVGFAQSFLKPEFIEFLKSNTISKSLEQKYKIAISMNFPNSFPDHFHFTQSTCVKAPQTLNLENTRCSRQQQTSDQNDDDFYVDFENAKNIDEYLLNLKKEILNSYDYFFKFDLVKAQDRYSYNLKPHCLLPEAGWNEKYLIIKKSGLITPIKTVELANVPIKIDLKVDINFDSNFKVKNRVLKHKNEVGHFQASLENASMSLLKFNEIRYSYSKPIEQTAINWCQ